jgi:protein phosphatase
MEEWLERKVPLQAQVDGLVEEALAAGGEDNITLLAVRNIPDASQIEG